MAKLEEYKESLDTTELEALKKARLKKRGKGYNRDYYLRHKAEIIKKNKERAKKLPETYKQYHHNYWVKNKEKIMKKHYEYIERNKEAFRAYQREYYQNRKKKKIAENA